jgi:hypothetical protein
MFRRTRTGRGTAGRRRTRFFLLDPLAMIDYISA